MRIANGRRLVLQATKAATSGVLPAAPALATPESIIDLDRADQRFAVVALAHGLHELVLDHPSVFVRHPEMTRQGQRRQAGFALGKQENRQKPGLQWQLGLLKQR